jgi:hypothetical protein
MQPLLMLTRIVLPPEMEFSTTDNIHQGPECDGGETTALSPFGLTTYRMEGDMWRWPGSSDSGRLSELHWAASSWLKQVGAHHPDFAFFTSHRR